MRILKLLCVVAILMLGSHTIQAQAYTNAIGVRLGYPFSVSYKHFFNENGAGELFAGFRSWSGYSWTNIGAMYEHHQPISGVDGLQWYFGGGVAVFFWNYKYSIYDKYNNTNFGIMGNLGLDYKFENAPINLSLDWVPLFFIGSGDYVYSGFQGSYGALSVRYVLK